MSGAIDVEENDGLPIRMCPICLHKLQLILGCSIVERYKRLLEFYEQNSSFHSEAEWVAKRLASVTL
jgi:hypothetical protein